jgi:ribosomal protein L30E
MFIDIIIRRLWNMPKKKTKRRKAMAMQKGVGNDIKDAIKEDRLLIGSNSVFREMKKGRLQSVICSSNLPTPCKKDLNHYSSVTGIKIEEFGENSAKLGETCGKPFNILLIGIKK